MTRTAETLPTRLGPYDGPTNPADRAAEAVLLASARTTLSPLYRGRPGDCFLLLYRAEALNIPVGVAADNIYIDTATGRAGLTAQLMAALLLRAGIRWTAVSHNDQSAVLRFRRGRKPVGTAAWHIREAVTAGLTRNDVWRQYPADCLWARAMSRGCRHLFPDIAMGMGYTPEEVREIGAGRTADDTDPRVRELLEQAAIASAETIRTELIPRAKRARLANTVLPGGRTCEQELAELWKIRKELETAAAADQAASTAGDPPDTSSLANPAGTGQLPCGCPAAEVLAGQPHRQECSHAVRV